VHSVWSKGLAGAAPKLSVFTHHGTSRLEGPTAPARVVLTTYETLVSDTEGMTVRVRSGHSG